MKYLYLILFVALLPSIALSQSNYRDGYVVKAGGDTTRGYINYRTWAETPKQIEFKTTKDDSKTIKFSPVELRVFAVTGFEKYITYTGPISLDKNVFPGIPDVLDNSTRKDTVFLRELYAGNNASLFVHADNIKTRFFLVEPGTAPVELEYHQYYSPDRSTVIETDGYKKQLYAVVGKNVRQAEALAKSLNKAKYTAEDLENALVIINNNAPNNLGRSRKPGTWLFAGASLNYVRTTLDKYLDGVQTTSAFTPGISVGFDVTNNANVQRFIFRGELAVSYINPSYRYPYGTTQKIHTWGMYTFSFTPQVLWNFYNTDNLKVFAGAGINLNYSKYTNNVVKLADPNYPTEVYPVKNQYRMAPTWVSYPLTIGVMLNKKIEISATYIRPAGYSNTGGMFVENQTVSVGGKYRFGGK